MSVVQVFRNPFARFMSSDWFATSQIRGLPVALTIKINDNSSTTLFSGRHVDRIGRQDPLG